MASNTFESSTRRRPIIPPPLIAAFSGQIADRDSRPTALGPVAWLVLISVAATVGVVYARASLWIIMLFTLFAAMTASLYVTNYVCALFGNARGNVKRPEVGVLHGCDAEGEDFDRLGLESGVRYFFARDLMRSLGYEKWESFANAIHRAMGTCTTMNISVDNNFARIKRQFDGFECDDYKLSRLACSLVILNGDTFRPTVAAAQANHIRLGIRSSWS
jgi:hypothetical protein